MSVPLAARPRGRDECAEQETNGDTDPMLALPRPVPNVARASPLAGLRSRRGEPDGRGDVHVGKAGVRAARGPVTKVTGRAGTDGHGPRRGSMRATEPPSRRQAVRGGASSVCVAALVGDGAELAAALAATTTQPARFSPGAVGHSDNAGVASNRGDLDTLTDAATMGAAMAGHQAHSLSHRRRWTHPPTATMASHGGTISCRRAAWTIVVPSCLPRNRSMDVARCWTLVSTRTCGSLLSPRSRFSR